MSRNSGPNLTKVTIILPSRCQCSWCMFYKIFHSTKSWKTWLICTYFTWFFFSSRFGNWERPKNGSRRSWLRSWSWPTHPSVAHQPAGCPGVRLGPRATNVDPILSVLPELPPRCAHPYWTGTEGSASSAAMAIHTVFSQHHCGPVYAEPALP